MVVTSEYIKSLKRAVRTKSDEAGEEIRELVQACVKDLEIAGVYVTDLEDGLTRNAVKLYVKAHYGYDSDGTRFQDAYFSLKCAMALSGDYAKEEE